MFAYGSNMTSWSDIHMRIFGKDQYELRYDVEGCCFYLPSLQFRPLVYERLLFIMFILVIIGIPLNKLFFALRSSSHTPAITFLW
jgi:hypothetical protein